MSEQSEQSEALRIADSIAGQPFAWPGGYRRHAITDDGGILCSECCRSERNSIGDSFPGDGWRVIAEFIHWEGGPTYCSHCGTSYPSEYGEDD